MGFQLRRISLLSPKADPAELFFTPGLNVVSGSSNTGKSFVVDLLRYALGGRKLRRTVPEAEFYDKVVLTIQASDGRKFTIQRALSGGDAVVYAGEGLEIPEAHDVMPASATAPISLSALFLGLVGFSGKRIREKQAETRNLSFRDLRELVVIDEQKIVATDSPVWSDNRTNRTAEASVFTLMLTGVDDAAVVQAETIQHQRDLQKDEADNIAYLLAELQRDIPEGTTRRSAQAQLRRIERSIAKARESYDEGFASVAETEAARGRLIRRQSEVKQQLQSLNQLVQRFRVLDGKYSSDLERLSAMGEAATHFETLDGKNCPVCGSALLDAPHTHEVAGDGGQALFEGLAAERNKIVQLQIELHQTIETLIADIEEYGNQLGRIAGDLQRTELQLQKKLKPAARQLAEDLGALEDQRSELSQLSANLERILRYRNQRSAVLAEIKTLKRPDISRNDSSAKFKFSLHVEQILAAWKYPEAGRVQFDEQTQDIAISGKHRASLGKGYRSVTASAFVLGLMEYCRDKDLPHPGFVVLDTPLRTFKDRQQGDTPGGAIVPDEVKDAFFVDIATRFLDRQVIVFENDEPPIPFRGSINYVAFTGNPDVPRAGFIPPLRLVGGDLEAAGNHGSKPAG